MQSMLSQNMYRLWIQSDLKKPMRDTSTKVFDLKLTSQGYVGILHTLMAMASDVKAIIHDRILDGPHLRSDADGYRNRTIAGQYIVVSDVNEIKDKSYYERFKYHVCGYERDLRQIWVLLKNPFRNAHFILHYQESELKHRLYADSDFLAGVFRLYELLGFNPKDHLLGIQDNDGNVLSLK